MKVSELNPPELDYWIAKAEGFCIDDSKAWPNAWVLHDKEGKYKGIVPKPAWTDNVVYGAFTPSTLWRQGGPIIERERIGFRGYAGFHGEGFEKLDWIAYYQILDWPPMAGPTPLIAAMRAYCAFKFSEEVPDEK